MTWYAVPAVSAVAALFLYFDFRRQGKRTPAVDALLGGCGILACVAVWTLVPTLLFG